MGLEYQPIRTALEVGEEAEGAVAYKIDFSSERKRMSYVVDNAKFNQNKPIYELEGTGLTLFTKGAPDMLFPLVKSYLNEDGDVTEFDDNTRAKYMNSMKEYAAKALRTFALAYKPI